MQKLDRRGPAGHVYVAQRAGDGEGVVAIGAVDHHVVDLAVTGGSTEGAGEVEVNTRDVSAGQVVDRHVVRAAERVEGHELDSARVHRDVRRLTEEPQP